MPITISMRNVAAGIVLTSLAVYIFLFFFACSFLDCLLLAK